MKEGDMMYVALEVTFRHIKGSTGAIVGFFREFPFVTGQAKTKDELVKQLQYALKIYFDTFPEGKKTLEKYGRVVKGNKITEKNIFGDKAPKLEIERPEIGSDLIWEEEVISLTA